MNAPLDRELQIWIELKRRLVEQYALAGDDPAILDTLDGETSLTDKIAALLRLADEDEALAEALGDRIDKMVGRRNRLTASRASKRAMAAHAMQEAGLKTIKADDITISVRAGKPRTTWDEARLPDDYWQSVVTRKPDRGAIQAAVDAGNVPEGVTISNPEPVLTVRTA